MKFLATTYEHPITLGTYTNVFIEDTMFVHDRLNKLLNVNFEMYVMKQDGSKHSIGSSSLSFRGTDAENGTPMSTNRTMWFEVPNPDYNQELGETPENPTVLRRTLVEVLTENNGSVPENATVVEWGYPNYTDALTYFDGGSMDEPELLVTNPLAVGFLLNKMEFNKSSIASADFSLFTE